MESRNPSESKVGTGLLGNDQSKQAAQGLPRHQGDGHVPWGAVGTGQQQLSSMEVSWGGTKDRQGPNRGPASMETMPISFLKLGCPVSALLGVWEKPCLYNRADAAEGEGRGFRVSSE